MFSLPQGSLKFFTACIAGALFFTLLLRSHRRSSSPVTRLLLWTIGLSVIGFGLESIPLFFTRDNALYTYFYLLGDGLNHASLFLFSVVYLYLIGTRPSSDFGTIYTAIMGGITMASYTLFTSYTLQNHIEVGDALVYSFGGRVLLLYSILYLPYVAFGIDLLKLARKIDAPLSRVRISVLGTSLILLGCSIIIPYTTAYFFDGGVVDTSVSVINNSLFVGLTLTGLFVVVLTSVPGLRGCIARRLDSMKERRKNR